MTVWTQWRELNRFRQVCTPSASSISAHPDKPVLMNMHTEYIIPWRIRCMFYCLCKKNFKALRLSPFFFSDSFKLMISVILSCLSAYLRIVFHVKVSCCLGSETLDVQHSPNDQTKLKSVSFSLCIHHPLQCSIAACVKNSDKLPSQYTVLS